MRTSGYQEMTLSSLSTSDYPCLLDAVRWPAGLTARPRDIGLSLPSLRADTFSMNLMERLQRVRQGRPHLRAGGGDPAAAGRHQQERLREEDLLQSCRTAFAGGWSGVKLYFMLGLPTETDEDVLGIADLARKVYSGLEGVHSQPQAGGADYGVHLLVRAQAPHGLSVGGPDPRGGVPAAGGACCGTP